MPISKTPSGALQDRLDLSLPRPRQAQAPTSSALSRLCNAILRRLTRRSLHPFLLFSDAVRQGTQRRLLLRCQLHQAKSRCPGWTTAVQHPTSKSEVQGSGGPGRPSCELSWHLDAGHSPNGTARPESRKSCRAWHSKVFTTIPRFLSFRWRLRSFAAFLDVGRRQQFQSVLINGSAQCRKTNSQVQADRGVPHHQAMEQK